MSEPTPPVAPLTPEELERWAVATVLETTARKEGEGAAVVGALKHEGTRALRGWPFTFCCRIKKGVDAGAIILHGTIAGVSIMAGTEHGENAHVILLHSNLIAGSGTQAVIACCTQGTERSGWFLSEGTNLDDRDATGTLEIG